MTEAAPRHVAEPRLLVFDSGIGGLSVLAEIVAARPDARITYVADDAGFPYGAWEEGALVARILALMERLVAAHRPDLVVIACNTASTLVLGPLRARFDVPFVGTVPAIKPAAERTRTGLVSVLATPGTVRRDYTRALIDAFAREVAVTLVGSQHLAALAEAHMRGEAIDESRVAAEIGPCFVEAGGRRTDTVVLACTHYPFLLDVFRRIEPWPVTWIDPAPAIARRVVHLVGRAPDGHPPLAGGRAIFTSGRAQPAGLVALAARYGLTVD
ncbi:glutamate racemase [Prosthecomicrobium sp. N25]